MSSSANSIIGLLQEFEFEGVPFPAVSAETDGGQDLVAHVAYGKRGADLEPTGLKAYRGSFRIACLDGLKPPHGNVFTERYVNIVQAFEQHPIGRLRHPTKGTFDAGIESFKETIDPNVRNGVYFDVHWIEHNATAQISDGDGSDSGASAAAHDADLAITDVGG